MIASHFLARSAAMIESKVVFLNWACTPICFATAVPISMSDPIGFDPWKYSSGGDVMSLQKTILPALAMLGGAWTEAPKAVETQSAARADVTPARTNLLLIRIPL